MFSSVAGEIGERIQQLEARLAQLELQRDQLDVQLAQLQPTTRQTSAEKLKFIPLSSKADAEFFRELGERKLNMFKLSDSPVDIFGSYLATNGKDQDRAWIEVRSSSFRTTEISQSLFAHERKAMGTLLNLNTPEQFKSIDKKQLLHDSAQHILDSVRSGSAFRSTASCLTNFLLLTYADLKKHKYLYWFGFPAFGFVAGDEPIVFDRKPMEEELPGYFEKLSDARLANDEMNDDEKSFFFFTPEGEAKSFAEWVDYSGKDKVNTFGFVDPSPSADHPSWLLRNFMLFLIHPQGLNLGGKRVRIASIREIITAVPRQAVHSIVRDIQLPRTLDYSSVVGWEHNVQDKMGPRLVDLSEMLDEKKLSEAACNLNLRLMKWRAFPDLDDQRLAQTKVLLLGAGTLGCAVARGLMGWGFRTFTFCDSGKVSYSNPVRQSLFVASDCHGTGKWKAQVAAERCAEIHPGVDTSYWIGNIPMPGHSGDPKAKEEFTKVDELIKSHDVICLLTDTRESRWLPTVIGAANDKIVLNAALGFDSFVVMRHGSRHDPYPERLGCYFCSDVVAPTDSTKDRTLDQQCTVTRPGCAPIAGAILVELLVGLVHHPLGVSARPEQKDVSRLGAIPHQVRGYLSSYKNDVIVGQAFPQCTGCSDAVLEGYRADGFDFVKKVLDDPNWLEEVTGLDKLKKGAGDEDDFAEDDFVVDDDEEEEEFDDD